MKHQAPKVTSDVLLADLQKLHPKLIDLSLGRVERLLAKLGHPEAKLPPVIHIAGTNGKGSVTAYLKAIFQAAGKRVHAYTSPHLVRFHERIELADADAFTRAISEDSLVDVLSRTQAVNDGDDITQFEITTAAALLAFAERPADVALLEVGLGGRLDATNVVAQPALCVITPVSMDHAEKLGDTLAKIAAEKAGILKRGVTAVIARQEADGLDVIEMHARNVGARLVLWGRDFDAYAQGGRLIVQTEDRLADLPLPALVGRHQIVNAGTAVAAIQQIGREIPDLRIGEDAIARGLQSAQWPARMQRLGPGPLLSKLGRDSELWLDGGHNPAAGLVLAETMADLEERSAKPLFLIAGMMGQKDAAGFLGPFRGLVRGLVTVPIPGVHEAPFTPEALADVARRIGIDARPARDVEEAMGFVQAAAPAAKRVLICGSLYLAGHVLALQDATDV